jgi:hypothetical protein
MFVQVEADNILDLLNCVGYLKTCITALFGFSFDKINDKIFVSSLPQIFVQIKITRQLYRCTGTGGFLRALRFPPLTKMEQILISLIIGSSEGGFRSTDERKRAEKKCEI